MSTVVLVLINLLIALLFIAVPILIGLALWSAHRASPPTLEDDKFWRAILWCIALVFWGLFAVIATIYLSFWATEKIDICLALLLYILPLIYIGGSIKSFNLSNKGLLLLFGIDICQVSKGVWFIPMLASSTVLFSTSLQEYQFPADSLGSEKDKDIKVSTGEHICAKTDVASGTVTTAYKKPEDADDEDVLGRIMTLIISPMVIFTFDDVEKLFKNFSDIYFEKGELGVSQEIARQIRDIIVATATALFPQKTAQEIFKELDSVNLEIFNRVTTEVADWGINLTQAKLATVGYDGDVQKYLDSVVEANTKAINHLLETKKDVKAYELLTAAKEARAKALSGPDGEKLAMILQLEVAVEIAKGSTNYNFGANGGMDLQSILAKIMAGHKP